MAHPDYTISVFSKSTQKKSGNIGAAWVQEDGRIQIQLNPGAALIGGISDFMITLFPYDGGQSAPKPAPAPARRAPAVRPPPSFDDMDDDIPF
jgi:hypothetical protein